MVLVRVVLAVIRTVKKKVKGAEVNLIQKRDTAIIPIKNLKVVAANPTHMEKVTTVPRGAIVMATRNPKAVEASPIHMGKTAMGTRAVMENLMATRNQHMEGMEGMARVLSNTSCIINTNWV